MDDLNFYNSENFENSGSIGPEAGFSHAMYKATGGKKIYIISTQATKDSNFYQNALCDYVVDAHATPEFVLMVEHNEITKEKVAKVILDKPFDSDGIILGCTHFNYLYDICHELLGDKVHIFDGLKNLEEYIINY